jgi:serine/threonine protein kinase
MKKITWLHLLYCCSKLGKPYNAQVSSLEDFLQIDFVNNLRDDEEIPYKIFVEYLEENNIIIDNLFSELYLKYDSFDAKMFIDLAAGTCKSQLEFPRANGKITYFFAPNNKDVLYVELNKTCYYYKLDLGQGSSSKAQLFEHSPQEKLVVKTSIQENTSYKYLKHRHDDIQIRNVIYADKGTNFIDFIEHTDKNVFSYTYFTNEPFVSGTNLLDAAKKAASKKELLTILLAVATELNRIHTLGYLHGDIKWDNIHIYKNPVDNEIIAEFIDFEWGYKITDMFAKKTHHKKTPNLEHFPTERTGSKLEHVRPDFSTDVYALANCLNIIYNYLPNKQFYPQEIDEYCSQAYTEVINQRPTLQNLIVILQKEINKLTSLSTTAMLMQQGLYGLLIPSNDGNAPKEHNEPQNDNIINELVEKISRYRP